MSEQTDTQHAWLNPEDIQAVRNQVPLVYVDAVPVRTDHDGTVTHVGMLLRQAADGNISRMVVSGRVLLNERIRDALMRHLEKDLGPMAFPRIPPEPRLTTLLSLLHTLAPHPLTPTLALALKSLDPIPPRPTTVTLTPPLLAALLSPTELTTGAL